MGSTLTLDFFFCPLRILSGCFSDFNFYFWPIKSQTKTLYGIIWNDILDTKCTDYSIETWKMGAGVCLECSGHFFPSFSSWDLEPSDSLTHLLPSNFISSLSVLLEVYFTFSVSLILLIRRLSKHLPSGFPSGRCYAVRCHHPVDQYSPLGFRGSKLYIFWFSFHIYIVFVFFKLFIWLSASVLFMLKAFFKHPWLTSNYVVHFKSRFWNVDRKAMSFPPDESVTTWDFLQGLHTSLCLLLWDIH